VLTGRQQPAKDKTFITLNSPVKYFVLIGIKRGRSDFIHSPRRYNGKGWRLVVALFNPA
jgi:hypothetical protein